jgi:hypothetical protein
VLDILYTKAVFMRMIFIEIIVFCALAMLISSCASAFKDMSIHGTIDFDKDGFKEEIGIEGKL